jgi:predicted O-methyltransferase YrrM
MNKLLEEIFRTHVFINKNNEVVEIHSATSKEQCKFLQKLIQENEFKNSIEIGFAYGISTLAIIDQVTKNNGSHVAIDPFENTYWGGNGLDLLEQAGYNSSLTFIEDFSYIVLPDLLRQGKKFDFAYIDTGKMLDFLMIDFFYLDKLLEVNGIIVFDDAQFPGIRKLLRYLSQMPHYEVCNQYPKNEKKPKFVKVELLKKLYPKIKTVLKEELLKDDYDLGVNSSCVALRKIDIDKRSWDWHATF